jgi:hypothetical protein
MHILKTGLRALILFSVLTMVIGCAEVGSDRWCKNMKEKPKGEWSSTDALNYAKHCIF